MDGLIDEKTWQILLEDLMVTHESVNFKDVKMIYVIKERQGQGV